MEAGGCGPGGKEGDPQNPMAKRVTTDPGLEVQTAARTQRITPLCASTPPSTISYSNSDLYLIYK